MTEERSAPHWDFDYSPIALGGADEEPFDKDLVLATTDDVDPARIVELLADQVPDVAITPLFAGHPIFWTRIESSQSIDGTLLAKCLLAAGTGVRYVTSSRRGSQRLPPLLICRGARPRRPTEWKAHPATAASEPESPWRWFLRPDGADVRRSICGSGAGGRLAIIDNDGRDLENVQLDAEVPIGVKAIPRAATHAACLLGWAIGAKRGDGSCFRGIAPDASPRFYCVPKGGNEIISLPLAIVRAVEDGADVVVCATYVEGQTSPLLDDALEFACRLGRRGRGTAVVFPTGREMSSSANSVHSSLSLAMTDPASDPRVFCVGPSSRDGGWFLWRDRFGKLRPFANRGPCIRWLAPGDDMANPFAADDRPGHAESSGASSIAAGVVLLVITSNPELDLTEVETLLYETASPVDATRQNDDVGIADRRDLMPLGVDSDGHNAKHGYGRLSATRACLGARDPVALVLVRMGEVETAIQYLKAIDEGRLRVPYGTEAARWTARVLLRDDRVAHALASVTRAVRLRCRHPQRAAARVQGELLRHLGLIVRLVLASEPHPDLVGELQALERALCGMLEGGNASEPESRLLAAAASVTTWGTVSSDHDVANASSEAPSTSGYRLAEVRPPSATSMHRPRVVGSRS